MIKLYGPKWGNAFRTHWLLGEVGIEYEHIPLDMRSSEHKKPEFLKLNPNGQVPVLIDGEFILIESLAINNYLAEKFKPELLGDNPQNKALVLQWSLWAVFNIQKYFGEIFRQKLMGINDEKIIENAKNNVVQYLQILDDTLKNKDYLVGNKFTLADINVATTMSFSHLVDFDYSNYNEISRWMKIHTARLPYIKARREAKYHWI